MITYNIALVFLRAGIAFLYIYAAFLNSQNKESMQWTRDNTKVLFRSTPWANADGLIAFAALAGVIIMYSGGISTLLGLFTSTGSVMLALFTAGGTVIHMRLKNDAFQMMRTTNDYQSPLFIAASSAFAAHNANILKNFALVLILISQALLGPGLYSVVHYLNL